MTTEAERDAKIVERFTHEPITMADIAFEHQLTRERVRQILKRHGLTRANGYKALSKEFIKRRQKVERLNRHCRYSYGCDFDTLRSITGLTDKTSIVGLRNHPLLKMWWHHRCHAIRMQIDWKFDLPGYAALVEPQLAEIGLRRRGLVLGRKDKSGPYSVENCHLVTLAQNSYDTHGVDAAHAAQIERSRRVTEAVAELKKLGMSNQQIADQLGKCKGTVDGHIFRAKKLGLLPNPNRAPACSAETP
jgi:hypothetical protein